MGCCVHHWEGLYSRPTVSNSPPSGCIMCPREFFPHHVAPLTGASHPGCVPNPWAINPCPSQAPPQQYIIINPPGLCLGLNQSSPPPGLCNLAHIAEMMPHRAACNLPKADLAVLSLRVGVIVRSESQGGAGCVKMTC